MRTKASAEIVPSCEGPNCSPFVWRRILTDRLRRTLLVEGDTEREIEGRLLLDGREMLAAGDIVVAPDIGDDVDDEVEDGEEEVLATFGTTGRALIASDGMRIPGVTFGDTGKSLSGLESLWVGTLRETARCKMPREAMEPPRSTISCRERFASASVVRGRDPDVDAERDIGDDGVELDAVVDCAVVDCGVDRSEPERCWLRVARTF